MFLKLLECRKLESTGCGTVDSATAFSRAAPSSPCHRPKSHSLIPAVWKKTKYCPFPPAASPAGSCPSIPSRGRRRTTGRLQQGDGGSRSKQCKSNVIPHEKSLIIPIISGFCIIPCCALFHGFGSVGRGEGGE